MYGESSSSRKHAKGRHMQKDKKSKTKSHKQATKDHERQQKPSASETYANRADAELARLTKPKY